MMMTEATSLTVKAKTHLLSVMLEDYFHVRNFNRVVRRDQWYRFEPRFEQNTLKTLDFLDRFNIKATFFVLGWIAEQQPELVREVARRGHEIAARGLYHDRDARPMTHAEFRDDVRRATDSLTKATGIKPVGYRAARRWKSLARLWTLDVLAEEGYAYDTSFLPTSRVVRREAWRRFPHTHHTTSGKEVWEFPLSTCDLGGVLLPVAGGNYFRQIPHTFLKHCVEHWHNSYDAPLSMYFHVWELDAEQPHITAASRFARISQYRKLDKISWVLEDYFSRYNFTGYATHLKLHEAFVPSESVSEKSLSRKGHPENSPAIHRWEMDEKPMQSRQGRLMPPSPSFQSSLTGLAFDSCAVPSDESLGYCQNVPFGTFQTRSESLAATDVVNIRDVSSSPALHIEAPIEAYDEPHISLLPSSLPSSVAHTSSPTDAPSAVPVSVVIPCFNEATTLRYLANTLTSVERALLPEYKLDFIFVNDCSTDTTWYTLTQVFKDKPNYRFVHHEKNQGVAAAIRTGINHATTDIVCSMDCDCSYDPHELRSMIPLLEDGVDMVTASPYHPQGAVRNVPAWRLSLSRASSFLYRRTLRQKLHTYTSCFRVYRRSAIVNLHVTHAGFLGIAETLGLLDLQGSRIVEHPTTLEVRLFGQSKMNVAHTVAGHLGLLTHLAVLRARQHHGHRRISTDNLSKESSPGKASSFVEAASSIHPSSLI